MEQSFMFFQKNIKIAAASPTNVSGGHALNKTSLAGFILVNSVFQAFCYTLL
jgi:hypothetical protein